MKSLLPICKVVVNQIWTLHDQKYVIINIKENQFKEILVVNKSIQKEGLIEFTFETEINYFLSIYKYLESK